MRALKTRYANYEKLKIFHKTMLTSYRFRKKSVNRNLWN